MEAEETPVEGPTKDHRHWGGARSSFSPCLRKAVSRNALGLPSNSGQHKLQEDDAVYEERGTEACWRTWLSSFAPSLLPLTIVVRYEAASACLSEGASPVAMGPIRVHYSSATVAGPMSARTFGMLRARSR